MSETTKTDIAIMETEKPYHFRRLVSTDAFAMFKIISKIGLNEFTDCFGKDGIKDLIAQFSGDSETGKTASIVGVSVALEIANVIFGNLPKCEAEIYKLLADVSGMSEKDIRKMDFVLFTEMIIDFIKKDEFPAFIKVVSKLFK